MEIVVNGSKYETNLTEKEQIDKCIKFFSDGCLSYAISFNNSPGNVITRMKVDNMELYVLRGFNFNYKFVPMRHAGINTAKDLLEKGLDLIELL